MTSYKNVIKYEYTQNPTDVVSLKEYILFDDGKDDGKFAILKFINNLDQKLYALQFEAHQYDESGSLIAKSLVVYDKFTADPGETFVPKAKLKLSANCAQISVKLLSARFDRVRWEKGEFSDNSYNFKRYVADEKRNKPAAPAVNPAPAVAQKPKKQKPQKAVVFSSDNIYRENYATFPRVFGVLVAILLIAGVVASSLWVRLRGKEFSIGDFDVVKTSAESVRIVGYDGKDKDVVIPAKLKDYAVDEIGKNAFRKSKITSVTFAESGTALTVSADAFYKCKSLRTVRSAGTNRITVHGNGFNGCKNIETIYLPNAIVNAKGFNGSHNVISSYFGSSPSDDEVFGIEEDSDFDFDFGFRLYAANV